MRIVKKFDRRDKIRPVSLRSQLATDLTRSRLTEEELFASFHLIVSDPPTGNQIFSAGSGLIHLMQYFPGGSIFFPLVRRFKPARGMIKLLYNQLAKLRQRSSSCSAKNA